MNSDLCNACSARARAFSIEKRDGFGLSLLSLSADMQNSRAMAQ
jgi:hypothetical protein